MEMIGVAQRDGCEPVEAYVHGPLAIHQKDCWAVTHRRTGMRVGSYRTLREAQACVKAIRGLNWEWGSAGDASGMPRDFSGQVNEVRPKNTW